MFDTSAHVPTMWTQVLCDTRQLLPSRGCSTPAAALACGGHLATSVQKTPDAACSLNTPAAMTSHAAACEFSADQQHHASPEGAAVIMPTQRSLNRHITLQPGIHLTRDPELDLKHGSHAGASAAQPGVAAAKGTASQRSVKRLRADTKAAASLSPAASLPRVVAAAAQEQSRDGAAHHTAQEEGAGHAALGEGELWRHCCQLRRCWPHDYATYHHFRCQARVNSHISRY